MKILIAGAGAMGARFGAMLQETGNDLVFADYWQEHLDKINEQGLELIVDGERKGIYQIPAYQPKDVEGEFDLIFVFTKAMQLDQMMQDIKHVMSTNTRVICLLNGLGHIEVIEKYITSENIYLGVTVWTSGLGGPGVVNAVGTGAIELQQIKATKDRFNQELLNTLNEAGLNVEYSPNVLESVWNKVALNAVLNTYCTLIDCNIREYGQYPDNRILTERVVKEVVEVGHAEGIKINKDKIIAKIEDVFDPKKAGEHYPSLYQDMSKGRPTEIDYLNGAIVRLAKKHSIDTPVCEVITHMIKAKEHVKGIQ